MSRHLRRVSEAVLALVRGALLVHVGKRCNQRLVTQEGDTPCVIVSCASRPSQQVRWSQVDRLSETEPIPAPSLLLVGRVARCISEGERPEFASIPMGEGIPAELPADAPPHPQG